MTKAASNSAFGGQRTATGKGANVSAIPNRAPT